MNRTDDNAPEAAHPARIDVEAVALPRRASPVPAPPPGTGGRTIALSAPIRFTRR